MVYLGCGLKQLNFVGSSLRDLRHFPEEVKDDMGYALHQAQEGKMLAAAKPLAGFGGAGILEIMDDFDGNTYRAAYTVKFKQVIYVLHCFQKKSKQGIKTPQREIELIRQRLKMAEADYVENYEKGENENKR